MLAPQTLRAALGRFATGVTIVGCGETPDRWVGLTVNSFASASLEPPLVLWSLRRSSPSAAAFEAAPGFVVNVLSVAQIELARRFAAPHAHRFGEGRWSAGLGGMPVLADAIATFECDKVLAQDAGDHRLYVGHVRHFVGHAGAPLLFQGGHYRQLGDIL